MFQTSQELRMLSSVTINCQLRMIVWIQVLNCQNCNQCLKCQVSSTAFLTVKNEGGKWGWKTRAKNEGQKLGSKMRVKNEGQKWGSKIRVKNEGQKSVWSNVSKVTSLLVHSMVLWRLWLLVVTDRATNQPRDGQWVLLSCSGQLKPPPQLFGFVQNQDVRASSERFWVCPRTD